MRLLQCIGLSWLILTARPAHSNGSQNWCDLTQLERDWCLEMVVFSTGAKLENCPDPATMTSCSPDRRKYEVANRYQICETVPPGKLESVIQSLDLRLSNIAERSKVASSERKVFVAINPDDGNKTLLIRKPLKAGVRISLSIYPLAYEACASLESESAPIPEYDCYPPCSQSYLYNRNACGSSSSPFGCRLDKDKILKCTDSGYREQNLPEPPYCRLTLGNAYPTR